MGDDDRHAGCRQTRARNAGRLTLGVTPIGDRHHIPDWHAPCLSPGTSLPGESSMSMIDSNTQHQAVTRLFELSRTGEIDNLEFELG